MIAVTERLRRKNCFIKTRSSSITKQRKMLEISRPNQVHSHQIKHIKKKLRVTFPSVSASIRLACWSNFYGGMGTINHIPVRRQTQVFTVLLKRHFCLCNQLRNVKLFGKEISCTLVSQHAFRNCVPFAGTVESVVGVLNGSVLLMDISVFLFLFFFLLLVWHDSCFQSRCQLKMFNSIPFSHSR